MKKFGFTFLTLTALALGFDYVFANTLAYQAYDADESSNAPYEVIQELGNFTSTSTISTVKIRYNFTPGLTATSSSPIFFFIKKNIGGSWGTYSTSVNNCGATGGDINASYESIGTLKEELTITFNNTCQLDQYYDYGFRLDINGAAGANTVTFKGSNNSNAWISSTYDYKYNNGANFVSDTLKDSYFLILWDSSSSIELGEPANGTTISYNPVFFNGTTTNNLAYDGLQVDFIYHGENADEVGAYTKTLFLPVGAGEDPFASFQVLNDTGTWSWRARFTYSSTSWPVLFGYSADPSAYSDENYFVFTSTTYSTSTNAAQLPGNIDVPKPEECSIGNLSGCFINALTYVFIPKNTILVQFRELSDTIQQKPPLGYFYLVSDAFSGISTSTATTTTYLSDSLYAYVDVIIDPINIGLIVLLWILFAVWLIHRIAYIEI